MRGKICEHAGLQRPVRLLGSSSVLSRSSCGRGVASYTGVLWVLTGTHPCDTSTQAGWRRYQCASSYVRGYVGGVVVHVVVPEPLVLRWSAVWFPQNLRIKRLNNFFKVASPCMDDHQFKAEENESVGELSTVCSHVF